jgi:hypothetical protein
MLGMLCTGGALGWPIALLGGKAGCLLVACVGILLNPFELAGKLPGMPPPDSAIELIASPATATKLMGIIFFICFTLLLDLVKMLTTVTILHPISLYHQTLKDRSGSTPAV